MKKLLLLTILLVSCQKDYYLEDLNEAEALIQSLQNDKGTLYQEINNLNTSLTNSITEGQELNNTILDLEATMIAANEVHEGVLADYNQLVIDIETTTESLTLSQLDVASLRDHIANIDEVTAELTQENRALTAQVQLQQSVLAAQYAELQALIDKYEPVVQPTTTVTAPVVSSGGNTPQPTQSVETTEPVSQYVGSAEISTFGTPDARWAATRDTNYFCHTADPYTYNTYNVTGAQRGDDGSLEALFTDNHVGNGYGNNWYKVIYEGITYVGQTLSDSSNLFIRNLSEFPADKPWDYNEISSTADGNGFSTSCEARNNYTTNRTVYAVSGCSEFVSVGTEIHNIISGEEIHDSTYNQLASNLNGWFYTRETNWVNGTPQSVIIVAKVSAGIVTEILTTEQACN